jgi:hypothetical protein
MTTGYKALDEIVERANIPKRCDRLFGARLYGHLTGQPCSEHTFRRLPIPYKKVGRSASYLVDDIVEAAKKELTDSLTRVAAPRRTAKPDHQRGKPFEPASPDVGKPAIG